MSDFKPLPVIQPQEQRPAAEPSTLETAGMVHDPAVAETLHPKVLAAIRTVFDPEIPVNIYDLGLIYDVIITGDRSVGIRMTLTAPACPAAQWLPGQVKEKVQAVEGVTEALVDVVFDPPWDKDRMSDEAKLQLGLW